MNPVAACAGRRSARGPEVAAQLIREYIYLYGAVSQRMPGTVLSGHATSGDVCFQAFLHMLARRVARQDILLVLDGAPNHRCGDLAVPNNTITPVSFTYSRNSIRRKTWDELREKIFQSYALKSMDAVRAKLRRAILYIERNPKLVRSITSFPYIVNSL